LKIQLFRAVTLEQLHVKMAPSQASAKAKCFGFSVYSRTILHCKNIFLFSFFAIEINDKTGTGPNLQFV
jgi:hypothetical protein